MSLDTNIQNLAARVAGEIKSVRTLVNGNNVDLSALPTTAKDNLVNAIIELHNEIQNNGNGDMLSTNNLSDVDNVETSRNNLDVLSSGEIASDIATAIATVTLASLGGLTQQEVDNRVEIIVGSAPEALDTLQELAAALGDDPNFAASINTALTNRVRFDAEQTLNATQLQRVQDNIQVFSRTQIGSVTTNYVTVFNNNLV